MSKLTPVALAGAIACTLLAGGHPQVTHANPAPGCVSIPQDIAIVIDTSGSMKDAIQAAQATAIDAANRISAAGGRVALVGFTDAGEANPAEVRSDFTSDPAVFSAATNALTANGGGDTPEAGLHAINTALNQLSWQDGADRSIILITDSTYHDPDAQDPTLNTDEITNQLLLNETYVYPLLTAEDVRAQYDALVAETGGMVTTLDDSEPAITELIDHVVNSVLSRPWLRFEQPSYEVPANTPLTLTPLSGADCAPLEVHWWSWGFEGGPDVEDAPSDSATLSYPVPGSYLVEVHMRTVDGQTVTATTTVNVLDTNPTPTSEPTASATTAPGGPGTPNAQNPQGPQEGQNPPLDITTPGTDPNAQEQAANSNDELAVTGSESGPLAIMIVTAIAVIMLGAVLALRRRSL